MDSDMTLNEAIYILAITTQNYSVWHKIILGLISALCPKVYDLRRNIYGDETVKVPIWHSCRLSQHTSSSRGTGRPYAAGFEAKHGLNGTRPRQIGVGAPAFTLK